MPEHKIRRVTRHKNVITIVAMDNSQCATELAKELLSAEKAGYREIEISCFGEDNAIYPNACVPIASLIDFFARERGIIFNYSFRETKGLLHSCHFSEPISLTEAEIKTLPNPFNTVLKYDNFEQVFTLTQKYITAISEQIVCEKGVLDGLKWCINEVMDNVNVHSERGYGFVMAQFHKKQKRIAFCIADSGVGIFNSLRSTNHHPSTSIDAISLAVQEAVSDGRGQGNGLFGLYKIIKANGGSLTITSHGASMTLMQDGTVNKYTGLPLVDSRTPGTCIDFQMDLSKKVNLSEAFASIGGYDEIDYSIEKLMDVNDIIQFDVYDLCNGTATREAGRLLRNKAINMIQRASAPICLDFSKVDMVSSSFIDEFLSKMVLEMGLSQFNQIVRIKAMNRTISCLFERSTYMRIYQEWEMRAKETKIEDHE